MFGDVVPVGGAPVDTSLDGLNLATATGPRTLFMLSVALEGEMAGELLTLIKVSAVLTYVNIGIYVRTVRDQFRVGRVVLYRLTTLVGRLLVPSLYV